MPAVVMSLSVSGIYPALVTVAVGSLRDNCSYLTDLAAKT